MNRYGAGAGLFVLLAAAACGQENELAAPQVAPPNQAAEHWSANDDPQLFGSPLQRNLGALPLQGSARRIPWVGSYWPTYLDSINYRWAGPASESAPHKYERAFAGTNVEGYVSAYHGLDGTSGSGCAGYGMCDSVRACGHRAGQANGRCTPFWWGLCHAWATAAILHPEPRHVVFYNGVRFERSDLKGLLSLVYNTAQTNQVSLRCETPGSAISTDLAGRPTDSACRDANPGTYHLLLANFLGLQGRSFIEDRTIGEDVWNQPIRGYAVRQMQEIGIDEANQVLGISNDDYPYNPSASRFAYVVMDVSFIREATAEIDGYLGGSIDRYTYVDRYEYVLEMDGYGSIVGGEWVGASKISHPDFLWLPLAANSTAVAGGAITYESVLRLVEASY